MAVNVEFLEYASIRFGKCDPAKWVPRADWEEFVKRVRSGEFDWPDREKSEK